MKTKDRSSNIELLRIILMLMVIGLHYNLIGMGNAFKYTYEVGINYSLTHVFESLCIIAVDVFILITGYFQIKKDKINNKKAYYLLILIFLLNIVQYLINVFIFKSNFNIIQLFKETISGKWFITIYIVLYIISPYINKMLNNLTKKEYKKLMYTMIFIFVFLQTILNYINTLYPLSGWGIIDIDPKSTGYCLVNFIVLYTIGGYLKLYGTKQRKLIYLSRYIIFSILIFLSWYIPTKLNKTEISGISFYYNNLFVVLSSINLFMLFIVTKIKSCKIINIIASTTITVFILSISNCFLKLYSLLNVEKYCTTKLILIHFPLTCIIIFIICSIVGYIGMIIVKLIMKEAEKLMFKLKNKKIKVYFIAQYKQGIDKFYDVVMEMKKNDHFNVKVIAFPYDIKEFPKNNDYEFWKEKFGDITINSIQGNDWFDIKKEKPKYVFIQRPYDIYLPEKYYINELSSFTKVCYIPYGYTLHSCNDITLNPAVIEKIDLYFAESKEQQSMVKKILDKYDETEKRKSIYVGYPILDNVKKIACDNRSAFRNINKNYSLNLIYTPRWSTDAICGTSFFKYKDKILKYIEENHDNLVFRPHPLMFENFINKKLMTKTEVKDYLDNLNKLNICYDSSDYLFDTFKESDVLITDFSSIIKEYLFFNKPIILLETDQKNFNSELKRLAKSFYVAKNWNDVEKVLKNLKKGIDPLKKNREKEFEKLNKTYDGNTCKRIIDTILDDYNSK